MLSRRNLSNVALVRLTEGRLAMCEKCGELDSKIDHYRRLVSLVTDGPTVDGINKLIEKMKAEKAALHP